MRRREEELTGRLTAELVTRPHTTRQTRRSTCAGLFTALCLVCGSILYGQQGGAGSSLPADAESADGSVVPRLINFSGIVKDAGGKPLTGNVILTLSLYGEQEDNSPLWAETQTVQLDDQGHYSLLLGATLPGGLPLDLFTSGKAQWLGVQPNLPAAAEQPRVLLVGMPYSLKAADADTLGGLPASAFVRAGTATKAASVSSGGASSNPTNPHTAHPEITGTITGVIAGTDLKGGGTSGTVTLNVDTTKVPQLASSNAFTANQSFKGNGNTAAIGDMGCGSGYVGLSLFFGLGASCTQYALLGDTIGNLFVNRPGGGSMYFREGNGTELTIASGGAITATGNIAAASFTGDGSKLSNVGSLAGNNTFRGNNAFTGYNSFYQNTAFGGNGEAATIGNMSCAPNSAGITFFATPDCEDFALLDSNGSTILNRPAGGEISFREGNGVAQMWVNPGGGVSIYLPLGSQTTELFDASYVWSTETSFCYIDAWGDINCSGSKSAVVPVDGGARNVALYAVESPENWFEDYGGGTLVNGSANVTLDHTFAQTVNTGIDYRVFVTPNGDCRGLYVTKKTATSFEVHELSGGQSNIDFDYRIVARRKGYESIRLADKTDEINAIKERAGRHEAAVKKP